MAEILDIPARQFIEGEDTNYDERITALADKGIVLWDVYKKAVRTKNGKPTSSDNDIKNGEFADIASLLGAYPSIQKILFNGQKAEKAFLKYRKAINSQMEKIAFHCLPSTSPANATISRETKKRAWARVLLPSETIPR